MSTIDYSTLTRSQRLDTVAVLVGESQAHAGRAMDLFSAGALDDVHRDLVRSREHLTRAIHIVRRRGAR